MSSSLDPRREGGDMMLQGVNLGGWLVLEKWMTPSLFDGTTAADETYFCHDLGEDRARERLKTFRDTFIQRRDFAEIADHGFNAVRIPVPFFIFEDIGPYIHCYEYLDRAFEWAEEFQLKILIDLHTVPGVKDFKDEHVQFGGAGITVVDLA